jgi:hypothetical protein
LLELHHAQVAFRLIVIKGDGEVMPLRWHYHTPIPGR